VSQQCLLVALTTSGVTSERTPPLRTLRSRDVRRYAEPALRFLPLTRLDEGPLPRVVIQLRTTKTKSQDIEMGAESL
jgi:hypothetical protein